MSADDLFNKAMLYYVGEMTGRPNIGQTLQYLRLAEQAGHKKAAYLLSNFFHLPYEYIYLEAMKLGSKRAYDLLLFLKNSGELATRIPARDLDEYNREIRDFRPVSLSSRIFTDDKYKLGLRFYVGEETGRQNVTKGREWLSFAKNEGDKRAAAILSSQYPTYYAYMAAAEIGIVKAAKKFTQWHMDGDLNGKISDAELIEFAKKIVALGDIY